MKTKTSSKISVVALLAGLAMFAVACGSDTDTDTATEETTASTEAAVEETEEAMEEEPEVEEAMEEEPEAEEAMAEGLALDMGEWFLTPASDVPAGANTFVMTNSGEFPHTLAIAKGTSYEELPLLDNGAVDTDALGADYLGTGENIAPGESGTVDFDLPAGDYVFFCPIARGPNSHAGAGQVLSVTVAG